MAYKANAKKHEAQFDRWLQKKGKRAERTVTSYRPSNLFN